MTEQYNTRNPFSMAKPSQNQQESEVYANALADSGNYPKGLDGCFTVGISGGCGKACWVYRDGKCPEPENIAERSDDNA